ncbi:hypothetical protein Bhyg_12633 [Pseudolycoriella hygida]|uniref:Uncharacterized protein n=1 Tax=Pseudolycoriella hygida TaxID=35572 RepID=A0A9Q0S119_9DIPT|nr:hypothetical protein Bhyg_12633 [Pseudolycoriella hygida]
MSGLAGRPVREFHNTPKNNSIAYAPVNQSQVQQLVSSALGTLVGEDSPALHLEQRVVHSHGTSQRTAIPRYRVTDLHPDRGL